MTVAVPAVWFGGPWDGSELMVPDDKSFVVFAEPDPAQLRAAIREEVGPAEEMDVLRWAAPVRYGRILWHQRRRV